MYKSLPVGLAFEWDLELGSICHTSFPLSVKGYDSYIVGAQSPRKGDKFIF